MEAWEEFEARRAELARHESNRASQAATFVKFRTTGQGPIEFDDAVRFDCAFTEEPWVSYGAKVDVDGLRNELGLDDEDEPPFPLTSGYVTEWDINQSGLYVGCWIAFRVHFPTDLFVPVEGQPPLVAANHVPPDVPVTIDHYFKWEAIALKIIG